MEIYTTTQTIKKCPYCSHVLVPPCDVHKATFFVLTLVEKGEATIDFYNKDDSKKKTVTVVENTCFFAYPFVTIQYTSYSKDLSYRNIIVTERVMMDCCDFLQEGLYDELLNLEYPPVFHISPPSVIYFAECASAIEGAKKSEKKDAAHRSLVCSLLNQYLVSRTSNNIFPKWINGFLRNLDDENFISKSVEEMVKTTNYSHGYVNREFKRYIGCSIKQFIIRKKLDRATVLLTTTDYSIEYFGDNSLVTNFGNAIKVMANKDNYPVFFHCSVGRDRTGWMGLCLNFLCGVSEEVAFKEFSLSLFSTSGAINKGHLELYSRFNRIAGYLNTFEGSNLSEKTEDYLVKHAGVTHEECENVRKILLGDIDTGFVPGEVNADPYTNLAKVTFRQYGQTPIIKLVEVGTLLEEPNIVGDGSWYHGDHLWDFANDVVTEDMYLDYILPSKCKVIVHYSGIDLPDDVLDVAMNTNLDLSMFNKDGYTFKVYDDSFEQIINLTVTGDVTINVVYKPTGGYIPKANSRVIVLAGQSNAAGVAHYQYLENSVDEAKIAEINNGYDNVLISGYSHDNYMTTFRKVYADKRSMTVGSPGSFGFELSLAERLSKVFPDETTYIIKHAYGGASLNYDWISPSGMSVDILMPNYDTSKERGWLYTGLVESTTNGLQMISQMTNTTPMIEAFMWMQGESDATVEPTLNVYVSSFNALISDYTTTFANNISYKFAVYDAAICETSVWALAKQMNAAKRSRVNNTNIYIETNDRITTSFEPIGNSTDNAHYDAACYIDLGHMFADAYLEKTLRGYTHNALEIEAPAKVTLTMGQNYNMVAPSVLFNGVPVNAKMSYFAEQHKGFNDAVYAYFEVNNTNTFTPLRTGKTQLRISAYYQDEVRTVLVPVEVVAN